LRASDTEEPDSEGGLPVIRGALVDYMYVVDEEDFYEGDAIVEEGKHGSWIWVILEGVVQVFKEGLHGPLPIMKIGDGSFVGSMASFLVQDNTRNATAVAVGNVQLGVLDSQRLAQEYSRMSAEFRGFIISLDRRLRQVTNRCVEIHSRSIKIDEYLKDKKPIIRQGNSEERLFQIRQGKMSIVRQVENGHVPLVQLQQGDFCGYLPFLDHGQEPDGASVLATDDFKVTPLDVDKLNKEFERISSTFRHMIQNVASCIAATTMVACQLHEQASGEEIKA
jgi:CRP-like cAMP-binding protein